MPVLPGAHGLPEREAVATRKSAWALDLDPDLPNWLRRWKHATHRVASHELRQPDQQRFDHPFYRV